MYIDAVVQGPHSLEIILHPLLQLLGHLVYAKKVFEIAPLALIHGPARVHALYDSRHVTEHYGVHQC